MGEYPIEGYKLVASLSLAVLIIGIVYFRYPAPPPGGSAPSAGKTRARRGTSYPFG